MCISERAVVSERPAPPSISQIFISTFLSRTTLPHLQNPPNRTNLTHSAQLSSLNNHSTTPSKTTKSHISHSFKATFLSHPLPTTMVGTSANPRDPVNDKGFLSMPSGPTRMTSRTMLITQSRMKRSFEGRWLNPCQTLTRAATARHWWYLFQAW